MATTPEQMLQQEQDFTNAFGEEPAAPVEQTEDEAFGLMPECAAGEAAVPAAEATVAEPPVVEPQPKEETVEAQIELPAEEAKEPASEQTAAEEATETHAAPDERAELEKERQRLKSWEGRLKAAEAKLKSAPAETEPAAVEALEEVASDALQEDNTPLAQAAEQAVEAVEEGELTADQAMKMLAEDFGDDFVRMIEVIATKIANEAGSKAASSQVEQMGRSVEAIVEDIRDAKERAHFEAIMKAHPDFADIGASQEFENWIASLPAEEGAEVQRIVQDGTTSEIIGMLDSFKASGQGQQEQAQEQAGAAPAEAAEEEPEEPKSVAMSGPDMEAAEGVRSGGGMILPEQPAASDDYEAAWREFG